MYLSGTSSAALNRRFYVRITYVARTGNSASDSDRTLGLVNFAMYPHLDHEALPENTMANAEKWAAGMRVRGYAIDDQSALKVTDGTV